MSRFRFERDKLGARRRIRGGGGVTQQFEGESRANDSAVEEKAGAAGAPPDAARPPRGKCYATGRPHRWTYRLGNFDGLEFPLRDD